MDFFIEIVCSACFVIAYENYIYSRKDGMKENLEERTNEEWMENYLENIKRLSQDKISKAEKKNLRFFEDEDEETYKIIWK